MEHHAAPLLLLLCMSSFLVVSAGPADVPLHDILGRNLTMDNVYYIRNYTVGSYSGGGLALYTAWPDYSCAKYVGFSSDPKDTGLAVQLVPYEGSSTDVIYPGERFKLVLDSPPPCRSPELGIEYGFGTYVVTRGILAIESYFRVDVDDVGRYTLLYCGFCASCNLCYTLGLSDGSPRFWSYGDDFNLFFQKKVGSELHQSQ